jgi:hypothetical protein
MKTNTLTSPFKGFAATSEAALSAPSSVGFFLSQRVTRPNDLRRPLQCDVCLSVADHTELGVATEDLNLPP